MTKHHKLLSIGEISKITGSSIKSLRYYERIGILNPSFINPDSGYRYYTLSHIYLIEMIQFAIDLDIPLKELRGFIDQNGQIDYAKLLTYGKEIAQNKLTTIQNGLNFIQFAEEEIEIVEKYHHVSKPYLREISEKLYYVTPRSHPFTEEELSEALFQLFSNLPEYEYHPFDLINYGMIHEYSPTQVLYYAFVEIPLPLKHLENTRLIPAGDYHCLQNNTNQIEQAPKIFTELFQKNKTVLVIESDLFASHYQVTNPIKELRAITLG